MAADNALQAKRMRLVGRVLGLGTVGFVLTFLIGETAIRLWSTRPRAWRRYQPRW